MAISSGYYGLRKDSSKSHTYSAHNGKQATLTANRAESQQIIKMRIKVSDIGLCLGFFRIFAAD